MAGYVYDGVGKTSTSSMPSTCSTDATANMVSSIQNPLKGLKDVYGAPNYRYTYDWLSDVPGLASDRWCNEDGTKSPFDPCPEGWRVPVSGIDAQSPWNDVTMSSYRQRLLSGCGLFLGFNDGGLRFARLLLECDHGSVDRTGLWVRLYPNCDQAVGFDPGLLCLSRPLREGVVRSGESLVTARRSRRAVFLYVFASGVYPRIARVDASAYLRFIFG